MPARLRTREIRRAGAGSSAPGAGSFEGFDELRDENDVRAAYAAHGAELYRFALRSLGDAGLAQDAVQETFLHAWRAASRFDPARASLRVWLFSIARNVVIDSARRRNRPSWATVAVDEAALHEGLEPVPDSSEEVLRLWLVEEAVRRLSEEHRQVIVETYLRGRSYDDLSSECGVPVGTLRSRCFYALKALRLTMEEMGVEEMGVMA